MSSVPARTGRHRQRYDNNLRLVAGCIPYRLTKEEQDCSGASDLESRIQVVMVSSPNRDDLVFPKGGWEDDETRSEAACREAREEAGVIGKLNEIPLGVWEFRSKSKQNNGSPIGGCKGYMFALEVTEVLESWPEKENRDRKWLNIREAFELCRYEWMRWALEEFLRVMKKERSEEKEGVAVLENAICLDSESEITPPNSKFGVVKGSSSSQSHHVISSHITSAFGNWQYQEVATDMTC